ncbi:hypothetical protein [Streptomyces sp. CA-132043]|uniref:hypothetical protein n=1 Tax=Streptomyces sp. CA-132043 TaxID=3240048 RepID=UPI003D94E6DD
MRGRKLWRGLRGHGVFLLVGVGVLVYLGIQLLILHQRNGFYFDPMTFGRPLIFLAWVAIPIALTRGRYRRSAETKPYHEVVGPLVGSREEYCLVLRPFGSDGEVVLPHAWFGASTMEQIVARATRKSLKMQTYALVDQDRRLAPPGPRWMRSPHDQWQTAVRTLIRRAHSIVLILPPGQGIREALKWEIEQITQHGLQTRLTVVLPPARLHKADYSRAFTDACVIMAAMEGFAGSIDDVNSLVVHQLELTLHERTQIVKYCRTRPHELAHLRWWFPTKRLRRKESMRFFQRTLATALQTTEQELSGLSFESRYPWRSSP